MKKIEENPSLAKETILEKAEANPNLDKYDTVSMVHDLIGSGSLVVSINPFTAKFCHFSYFLSLPWITSVHLKCLDSN